MKISRNIYSQPNEYELSLFWVKNEEVKFSENDEDLIPYFDLDLVRIIAKEKGDSIGDDLFEISRVHGIIKKKIDFYKSLPEEAINYLELKEEIVETKRLIYESKKDIKAILKKIEKYEEELADLEGLRDRGLKFIKYGDEIVSLDCVERKIF